MDLFSPYRLCFELLMYLLLGWSLVEARREGWLAVWEVLAGVLFGLTLEWATIHQLHAYRYGRFLVMVAGEVPLAVGVGWGIIIHAARHYTARTGLPRWARPVLTALLALNIDLSMDTLAIRLGMWDWGQGLHFQYFGVPWANFWAWFWVVFSFSAALTWTEGWHTRFADWLRPGLAFLAGLCGVLVMNVLIVFVIPWRWHAAVVALLLLGALGLILSLHPRRPRPLPPTVRSVPFTFHLVYLVAGLLSGVIFHPPALFLISLLMALLAWWLYEAG